MLSILPTNTDNVPCVPIKVFKERICDMIEKKTGKRPSVEELQQMDMGDIERIREIKAKPPTKIRRGDPSSLYRIRSRENAKYNKAVIDGLLMKKNYFN